MTSLQLRKSHSSNDIERGADSRNRTDDLIITSDLLYQLSYVGIFTTLAALTVLGTSFSMPFTRGSRRLQISCPT